MITYRADKVNPRTVHVLLDGKKVGKIYAVDGGFQYVPNGTNTAGAKFATMDACKASLS